MQDAYCGDLAITTGLASPITRLGREPYLVGAGPVGPEAYGSAAAALAGLWKSSMAPMSRLPILNTLGHMNSDHVKSSCKMVSFYTFGLQCFIASFALILVGPRDIKFCHQAKITLS